MTQIAIRQSPELQLAQYRPPETPITDLAQMAVQRAISLRASHLHPDFGPLGIGRLPNDLGGYPTAINPDLWQTDFSIYETDMLPAYILSGRQSSQDLAC